MDVGIPTAKSASWFPQISDCSGVNDSSEDHIRVITISSTSTSSSSSTSIHNKNHNKTDKTRFTAASAANFSHPISSLLTPRGKLSSPSCDSLQLFLLIISRLSFSCVNFLSPVPTQSLRPVTPVSRHRHGLSGLLPAATATSSASVRPGNIPVAFP